MNAQLKTVLEKYQNAEKINPAFERVTIFSWNDMLCLKNEIERLQKLIDEHNAQCVCHRDTCGYANYQRRCPECPAYWLIDDKEAQK